LAKEERKTVKGTEGLERYSHNVDRLVESMRKGFPKKRPELIPWAEENVIFPKSVLSKHFRIDVTPWIREPMERAVDLETRTTDLRKPIQSGGSVSGEVVMLYWINFFRGFLQYNWSNDDRAQERWNSRIDDIIQNNLAEKLSSAKFANDMEIDFGNVFFRMQGVFVADNLDSDSIALQLNEELHSWKPGMLKKAEGRHTAVWNFKQFDVSNAGDKGDQFDVSHSSGTDQTWEVKCIGCGKYHVMQTRWNKRRPDLGGLRYDADGCRVGFMDYNYNKLRPTIEYWMPCGHKIHNQDKLTRKQLSLSGKYTDPRNKNAELTHRSYSYDSVIVDTIDWMDMIKAKHEGLKARKCGDPEPYKRYVRERECVPYDENDVPATEVVAVVEGLKKSREGLPSPRLRLFGLDRQQGEKVKNELPHWWIVIRDVKIEPEIGLRSRLVYEGKEDNDAQVIAKLDEFGCNRWQGVADSGDDTMHVYQFCMKHGINAIKGGNERFGYVHPNQARRIFSPERPLHQMLGRDSLFPYIQTDDKKWMPDPREPMFWLYVKNGIRERLHWLRENTLFETPDDVSDDYTSHQDSEEREEHINPSDGSREYRWVQKKHRNDQFVNECYIAMQIDQANLIGAMLVMLQQEQQKKEQNNAKSTTNA
jgi:hypothetical protein